MEYLITLNLFEFVGYLATVGVAASILLSNNVKSKWYSLFLAVAISVFGFVIANHYVGFINLGLAVVSVFIIMFMHRRKEYFKLFEVDADSKYLKAFVEYYFKEINRTVPYYTFDPDENTLAYVLLRNMAVVGVFLAKRKDESTILVDLDFVIPEFRDYRMGKHVYFHNQEHFYEQGFRQFHIVSLNKEYDKYLIKMGFKEDNSTGERIFVREISKAQT